MEKRPRETLGYRGPGRPGGKDPSRLVLHCIVAVVSWMGAALLVWSAVVEALLARRMGMRMSAISMVLGAIGMLLLAVAVKFTWKIVRFRV